MLFKTIAFIILLYLLVKVIGRLFLPSPSKNPGNARIFYRMYRNMKEHQQKQQNNRRKQSSSSNNFEDIEEAEYVEIEEETDSEENSRQ